MSSPTSSDRLLNVPPVAGQPQPPLVKRMAMFGLILLVLFYVVSGFIQARDNHRLLNQQTASLNRTSQALDRALADLKTARAERQALIRIALAQNEEIKRLGGRPIDVLGTGAATQRPSSGPQSPRPEPTRSDQPSPAPRPSPTHSTSPTPTPSASPTPLACVQSPLGHICTPVLTNAVRASYSTTLGSQGGKMIDLDPHVVTRLLGLFIPLLVALITKRYASSGLKAVLNMASSAFVGALVLLVDAKGHYDLSSYVNNGLDTFIASVVSYYSFLRPTGLAGSVAKATANFGLGSPPDLQTDDVGAEQTTGGGVY